MSADQNLSVITQLPADKMLQCRHCGITFVWTGWEQYQDDTAPELCPGCRHLSKL